MPELIDLLLQNECPNCGSVPVFLPQGGDDVSQGELTINYVADRGGCDGFCPGNCGSESVTSKMGCARGWAMAEDVEEGERWWGRRRLQRPVCL